MALMLRKACQPLLDKAGLVGYYADISEHSKGMMLHNVCGKPFAGVHGVNFGRMHPTKEEIEFAVELLDVWLKRNQTKLSTYILELSHLSQLEKPKNETEFYKDVVFSIEPTSTGIKVNGQYIYEYKYHCVTIRFKDMNFTLDKDGTLVSVNVKEPLKNWGLKITLSKTYRDAALKHLQEANVYITLKNSVEKFLAELNSCCAS